MPRQRSQLEPDIDYAVYQDGKEGKTVRYYSVREDYTLRGNEAAQHFKILKSAWQQVKCESTQEGIFYYFQRRRPI